MKDWPITYRIAVIAALLFCFSVILRQFFVANEGLPIEVAAMDELGDDAKPFQLQKKELYPPVPAVLPDLNENYLFNSERNFSENELEVGSATGSIDLAEVTYAGSLIVGEIRMALVTYKEKAAVAGRGAASRRPGAASRRTPAKNTEENRQLAVGNNFMGYIVDKIEKDRIVFKKGNEMVVKFLYDSGKDRSGIGQPINSSARQPVATTTSNRTVSPPPVITRPPRDMRPKAMAPTANDNDSKAQTIRSRSELLRGLDPNIMLPPSSRGAGDHQRR